MVALVTLSQESAMSSSSLFFPRGPLPCDYLPEASLIVSPTQTPQFRQTQEFP